jgi:hypothetical protein
MEDNLGPIDLCCDSPPYFIVQACRQLGIHTPEDVAWFRVPTVSPTRARLAGSQALRKLLGMANPPGNGCVCGQPLPRLDKCTFTLSSGREVNYLIGQCDQCLAIYWDGGESTVAPSASEPPGDPP